MPPHIRQPVEEGIRRIIYSHQYDPAQKRREVQIILESLRILFDDYHLIGFSVDAFDLTPSMEKEIFVTAKPKTEDEKYIDRLEILFNR